VGHYRATGDPLCRPAGPRIACIGLAVPDRPIDPCRGGPERRRRPRPDGPEAAVHARHTPSRQLGESNGTSGSEEQQVKPLTQPRPGNTGRGGPEFESPTQRREPSELPPVRRLSPGKGPHLRPSCQVEGLRSRLVGRPWPSTVARHDFCPSCLCPGAGAAGGRSGVVRLSVRTRSPTHRTGRRSRRCPAPRDCPG
jgi:hypothetical protein